LQTLKLGVNVRAKTAECWLSTLADQAIALNLSSNAWAAWTQNRCFQPTLRKCLSWFLARHLLPRNQPH